MIQRRLHSTAQTDLSLYVAYTHAPLPLWLVAVSRFSGSAVSKVIKKKIDFAAFGERSHMLLCHWDHWTFLWFSCLQSKTKNKKNENTENTAGAFHSKNEKPFANGCKSAKNQLRVVKMFFGSELICDTLAWHFRVSHYCVTTSGLTFGPIMRVLIVFSNYCYVLINKPSRRFHFCVTVFLV